MVITLGLLAVASIWQGFVLSVLWGWFMVPALEVPALSVVHAIGIAMIVRLLTKSGERLSDDVLINLEDRIAYAFLFPATILALGFIVKLFA